MKLIAVLILLIAGLGMLAPLSTSTVVADGNPCSPGLCKPRPPTFTK